MKRCAIFLLTLSLLFGTENTICAQNQGSKVFRYTSANGLAHDNIAHIYVDSRGFVWSCTWCGISRYDGYEFKNFATITRFLDVKEDTSGDLWFRSYDNHLMHYRHSLESIEEVGIQTADDWLFDPTGQNWVEWSGIGLANLARPDDIILRGQIDHLFYANRQVWAVSGTEVYTLDVNNENIIIPTLRTVVSSPVVDCAHIGSTIVLMMANSVIYLPDGGGQTRLNAPANVTFTCIAADTTSNSYYLGTKQGSLWHTSAISSQLEPCTFKGETLQRVRMITPDSQGRLWIITSQSGVTLYRPQEGVAKRFRQHNYSVGYYRDTIARVVEQNGKIWVKMNNVGFGWYDPQADSLHSYYNDPNQAQYALSNGITSFDFDANDVLWISPSYERGLFKILPQTESKVQSTPPEDVRALYLDRHGNTWIGTKGNLLLCMDSEGVERYRLERIDSTSIGRVYAIFEDKDGYMWIGTRGEGVYRLTPQGTNNYQIQRYLNNPSDKYSLSSNEVYNITQDTYGRLWFATYGGAVNMLQDANSTRFVNINNSFGKYPTQVGQRARYVLCDSPNRMFIATTDGLLIFDPSLPTDQMTFRIVQRTSGSTTSLRNNDIIHLFKDSNQHIWLSTFGGGLQMIADYTADGVPIFESYDNQTGLPSNVIFATVQDHNGDIWALTQAGVSRFDRVQNVFSSFTDFEPWQPIAFNETAAVIDAHGDLLFGSYKYLHRLDPNQLFADSYDYNLVFTELQIPGRTVGIGEKEPLQESINDCGQITLPYDYLVFRIDYASLNHLIHDKINYMYKLDGFDKEWNIAGDVHSVPYSNVPYGNYVFRVKAYVDDIKTASGDIAVNIRIKAAPWQQWWAFCIYALLLFGVLFVVYRVMYALARLRSEVSAKQDLTEMKLTFFTNISHELRTPLSLIVGGVEEIRDHEELSEKGEKSLNLAYKNAKRMLTLINQLLDFRKIVKDKMELKISRFDLVSLVRNIIDNFRDTTREHQIDLFLSVSHDSIWIWADPQRMETVFYNLLSNAIKFTPDNGKIEFILSYKEMEGTVVIQVKDNGIGIPRDKVNTIFERFAQGPTSLRGEKGSGIGLALCKEIVELHHGQIWVDSKTGEGSTFTVIIQTGNSHYNMDQIDFLANDNYVDDDNAPVNSDRVNTQPPADAQKLLLVDDNREMRAFIYNHLIDTYFIIEAVDGVDALEKIRTTHPDLMVTDLMMPNMDGIELVNAIRNDFEISHIPIIMLTAKHDPENRIKAMEYGADGYITKPFSIELLQARIENLLTQRKSLFERFSVDSAKPESTSALQPKEVVVTDQDQAFLRQVSQWIEDNIENSDLTIDQLAAHVNLGRTTMYNKIKSLTGKSPVELIKEYRLNKSKLYLNTGQFSVSEVAYRVGFSDPGYFSRSFKEFFRMTPAEYMKSQNKQ